MSWVLPRPSGDETQRAVAVRAHRAGLAVPLILTGYLLLALLVTWRLWAHPASATVAGNPGDSAQFAWFLRYDATAVLHGHLPALVTTAMNAPTGINLMWNTSVLLPGVLLTPVTALAGPQVSLTVIATAGFAGSAAALFFVLRRHGASAAAAAIGGAIYGFSPALLHAAVGHFNLQFAVLPPLIIDAAAGLCTGSRRPVRGGIVLGLLVAAQLFTGEELLADSAIAVVVVLIVLMLARPRAVPGRAGPAVAGLAIAAGVALLLTGWALRVQLFGPLRQHGSAFLPDFYKNDLLGFIAPSNLELIHTRASAAFAASFQGGTPEYLAYLGVPLILFAMVALCRYWRELPVLVTGISWLVLEVLSLGAHLLLNGHAEAVTLPWAVVAHLPVLVAVLPGRLSILADGAAGALVAFAFDLTVRRYQAAGRAVAVTAAVVVLLPLLPAPLPATPADPLPAGWTSALTALRLPAGARLLVVPVPTAQLTAPLRWQADSGARVSLIGGYFQGPAFDGHVYIDGNGPRPLAVYLDNLWSGQPAGAPPAKAAARADLSYWHPSAVLAVVSRPAVLTYLDGLLGRPAISTGQIRVWRIRPGDL